VRASAASATALAWRCGAEPQPNPPDLMSTFTQIYYHIVFSTKDRARVLLANRRDDLFRYTWGILRNKDCHLYRIGGVEDHIHILTGVHPTLSLAELVRDIKIATSQWIKKEGVFPDFAHWQDGYGAFTVSHGDKDAVVEYIRGQEQHHKQVSFKDELREFLTRHGITFDEKYLV
jgi:REP element-mobilizing transposase RayT